MLIYVAHKYTGSQKNLRNAMKMTRDLQISDPNNCYICPLCAFYHLDNSNMNCDLETEIHIDLLSACDVLLVASEVVGIMKRELDFAESVGMEVRYIDEYRFT